MRQTGLLVRGDLDLKLQTQSDPKVARISGTVNLRDSLFLQDVRAFLPKGGGGGAKRPPYFSVNTPPLNTWPLAVEVTGERFLRLRETAFADEKSFFHKFSLMSEDEAKVFGRWVWETINRPNLVENIQPTRTRADLILKKGPSHFVEDVLLRRI